MDRTVCPKDNKYCYVHHDKETGYELDCRHYNLINYGGCCPDLFNYVNKSEVSK
jgi:hypothetical protein